MMVAMFIKRYLVIIIEAEEGIRVERPPRRHIANPSTLRMVSETTRRPRTIKVPQSWPEQPRLKKPVYSEFSDEE